MESRGRVGFSGILFSFKCLCFGGILIEFDSTQSRDHGTQVHIQVLPHYWKKWGLKVRGRTGEKSQWEKFKGKCLGLDP